MSRRFDGVRLRNRHVFALDLGTTKFCLAHLYYPKGSQKPDISILHVPAAGMRRGMLSHIEEATAALNALIYRAEQQWQVDITKVSVGIAGSHIKYSHHIISESILQQRVSGQDLDKLIKKADRELIHENRELLHLIPTKYVLDDRVFYDEPIGFAGNHLAIHYLKVDGDQFYLQDVLKLCNNCGLKVKKFVAEPIASAAVVLSPERRELGVVMIDIGGGTTDGVVFMHGKPLGVFTINIAGQLMTKDLSIGLGIQLDYAEKIKHELGILPFNKTKYVQIKGINNQTRNIGWQDIYPILGARLKELSQELKEKLSVFPGQFGAGMVITGGGSEIEGIEKIIEHNLKMPTCRITPSFDIAEQENKTFHHRFATAVGIINLELDDFFQNNKKQQYSRPKRYLSSIINWLKELS